jgi:hypothetical protein
MSSVHDIESALHDPQLMEEMYHKAERAGMGSAWSAEIARLHAQSPNDPLLAAWYYRLQTEEKAEVAAPAPRSWHINWQLAVPLGLILGVIYWILFERQMALEDLVPTLVYAWAPLAAIAIIALVAWGAAGDKPLRRVLVVIVALAAVTLYVTWIEPTARTDYQIIAVIHLPLMAVVAIGLIVAGPGSDDHNRFAFLIKATEAVVTGGIFGGATMLFFSVTVGIFEAIGVTFPDTLARLVACLAAGLTPLLAVAMVYDARFTPLEQRFEDGLSKLISTLGRFFLPLTLLVGIVYVVSIPFNFWRPFEQRDVLIIYNLMLFSVMGLLIFATPVLTSGLSSSMLIWLRRGIVAVAALTVLVSLYALSATVYRTSQGGFTVNRTTIIGWNAINIAILVHLLYRQARAGQGDWLAAIWRTCRLGAIAYAVWSLFLLLAIPWLFP